MEDGIKPDTARADSVESKAASRKTKTKEQIKVKNLTLDDFIQTVTKVVGDKITSIAPLGFSGDDIVLDGLKRNAEGQRESLVSLRRYGDSAELLITDKKGRFLTYQKYGFMLGIPYISQKFYEAWKEISNLIESDMDGKIETVFAEDAQFTAGFKILELALAQSATGTTESA